MGKSLFNEIGEESYRHLRRNLNIGEISSKQLIKSTHGFSGVLNLHPYAIVSLIKDCENKKYQGKKALTHINSNIEQKAIEIKSEIEQDLTKVLKYCFE